MLQTLMAVVQALIEVALIAVYTTGPHDLFLAAFSLVLRCSEYSGKLMEQHVASALALKAQIRQVIS